MSDLARTVKITAPLLLAAACGGGGATSSPVATDVAPEMLACRARVNDAHRFAEIAVRSVRNLGSGRISDRSGPELRARLHPDGVRVLFARERSFEDPDSRELFVATLDGSAQEQRLTQNTVRDDEAVWSPNGDRVLFASERDGQTGLWIANADGSGPLPFLPVPAGSGDGEPDWHGASDRIVWSRRGPDGRHTLWLVNGSGFTAMPLTDGGTTLGPGSGDRDPAFSPDGTTVAFARRTGSEQASLCLCEVATGAVTVRLVPDGDVALPRFDPGQQNLYFGLAEPAAGRATLRLASLPLAGGDPTLVWPDERWRLRGIDFVPTAPGIPPALAPERLDVTQAQIQIAFADYVFGSPEQLSADDDNEFFLLTANSGGREIAGINCRYDLPLEDAADMLELRVRAVMRSSRIGGDGRFRLSVYNPVDTRFDTVVEVAPTSTDEHTLEFRTTSLRHVTREKQFRVTVGVDLDPGDPADFWIDLVAVDLVRRAGS